MTIFLADSSGFFGSLKKQIEYVVEQIKRSNFVVVDAVIAFGFGFLIGFLVKKFSQLMLLLALFIIGLVVLQQFDLISISCNVSQVQSMLGVKQIPSTVEFFPFCWAWVKAHVAVSVSFVVGALLGLHFA